MNHIILNEITKDNWIECVLLSTDKKDNKVIQEFIASNALSIAQSKIENGWIIKAIYNGEIMIGFTMYGYNEKYNFFELCRLMIDYKYQGNGFGQQGLEIIIKEMRKIKGCKEIFLSFDEKNEVAKRIYI